MPSQGGPPPGFLQAMLQRQGGAPGGPPGMPPPGMPSPGMSGPGGQQIPPQLMGFIQLLMMLLQKSGQGQAGPPGMPPGMGAGMPPRPMMPPQGPPGIPPGA